MSQSASANGRVNRVTRVDGSVRILSTQRSPLLGWEAPSDPWLTREAIESMLGRGVKVVLLRRGFRKAEVPLAWLAHAS